MRALLLAASALVILGGAACAPSAASAGSGSTTASSTSGATATSSTRSSSRAASVGNSTTINVDTVGTTGTSGTTIGTTGTSSTGGDPTVNYSGGYTERNTPEVMPPNVVGGNPCAVGASGGIALPGIGVALGGTWADRACERRQQAALLFNMGQQNVALALLCQDDNVRAAMKVGGKPCAVDIAAARAPVPAAVVTVPAPLVTVPAPNAAPAPIARVAAATVAAPRPEWCAKAAPSTEASAVYVAQMCGR